MYYRIAFAPEAEEQLSILYQYIALKTSSRIALNYIEKIVEHCESLSLFPMRGIRRDDILPGLRITHYRKKTIIAFMLENDGVTVLGIWYGGQNYEMALSEQNRELEF